MKKFKNALVVTGTPSLLRAFESEIKELGYITISEHLRDSNLQYLLVNKSITNDTVGVGECIYQASYASERIKLHLPQDYTKAIQLASEVEEEVPEYVKCTKSEIFNALDDVVKGSIWKTDSKGYPDGDYRIVWSDGSGQMIGEYNKKYFIPATKAEFDAQEKRLKEEELLKEAYRRFPIGTKFISTFSDKGRTIEIKPFSTNKDVVFSIGYYSWDNYKPSVRCENGINGGGCSNPQLYIEGKGWCEIVKDEFKVGDWVVFNPEIAKDLNLYSDCWNKPYVLKISDIKPSLLEEGGQSLEFTSEEMKRAGYITILRSCSNNSKCFRRATTEEIQAVNYPKYVKCIDVSGGNPVGIEEGEYYEVEGMGSCPECRSIFYFLKNIPDTILNKRCGPYCQTPVEHNTFKAERFVGVSKEEFDENTKVIKIAGYKAEFSHGDYGDGNVVVSFGCKKNISQSDVYAIEGVMELSKRLNLDIQCYNGILTINDDVVSEDTISELIEKLD